MRYVVREPFPPIYQDSHENGKKFEIISKSQFKKAQSIWARKEYKNEDKRKKLLEDEEKRLKNLEEAKTIVIQEDSTLSKVKQRRARIVHGWVIAWELCVALAKRAGSVAPPGGVLGLGRWRLSASGPPSSPVRESGCLARRFRCPNPDFKIPYKPFKRMDYKDAIEYLRYNNITKDDGTFYEFGEDIPEMSDGKMTDAINEPIMLCRFSAEIKSFYMQHCADDKRLTVSVDVLLPYIDEIVGASTFERISDYDEPLEGYSLANIDTKLYYWYTGQRKYGTCPDGGFGLGLERFLCWLLNRFHVRDACLYPCFLKRCRP
ncbi:LOW QUALITY PROTEIN: asparagine--tRNA ligase, cytoplasmic [Bombus vancouverensis nearcticus]|uniref:LOW QUALITY PROTEIN: asparagine--tRNA ligase, cytoplasmic n=1 Tax=Bombus vancouverensis nearcticus TaxID=2705178 RepID=UPI00402BCF14